MDQLIPIVNKLQDVFSAIGQSPVNLPQIVVIGSQSSGKSSVLENIVGRDFLPRGSGIVTRRPLILQLYNSQSNSTLDESQPLRGENDVEWGEFLHIPGKKFTDFSEIRREIERETDRLTGKNKGISNKTINLKIFSPYVLNLTLVDLPGVTKVPVGDQPVNIEEQIRDMCVEFISNPNSIILAVTSANTDLANSDALKLAREIDPAGDRTIGVLTKIDLMDEGTDALEMLQGRVISLRRGFVGVVNRSQADINNNVSIRDSLQKEHLFFQNHTAYRTVSSKMGTQYLSKTLNTILMHHIRDCLPEIKSKIGSMVADLDQELAEMGSPTQSMSKTDLGGCLLHLISHFSTNFSNSLDGRHNSPNGIELHELYGGARIHYIFGEIFIKALREVDPFDTLSDEDIRTTIRNANGPRQSLFVPEVSFELLAKRQIKRLEQPGIQCVDLIFDELQRVASQCETMELSRFPELRDRVLEVVNKMLRACVGPTQTTIQNLIQIELAYINTNHPDFIGGSRAVAQLMEKMQRDSGTNAASPNVSIGNGGSMVNLETLKPRASISDAGNGLLLSGRKHKNDPRSASVKLPQVPVTMRPMEEPTDRERIETEIIKSLLASYFDIVRKNFLDLVPKSIMCFMVLYAQQNVQNELVSALYREDQLADLLRETSDIATRRSTCCEMRTLLQRALEIVNEVRDFNTFK
uniref:dynamin GTPase n=1 Tax=Albugo laibachii Nc14 TaxID=890382 RepID=F0W9Q8_9STRA|nr:dynamin GTPase putative [Albugo laibachii Nc14]|eukprot:CCA17876.1 dynamin GTPase putative [Albugo laibachii Nc14]